MSDCKFVFFGKIKKNWDYVKPRKDCIYITWNKISHRCVCVCVCEDYLENKIYTYLFNYITF